MARKTYSSSVVAVNDVCERVMALAHDVALTSMILSSWLAYSVLLEAHQSPLLHNLPCPSLGHGNSHHRTHYQHSIQIYQDLHLHANQEDHSQVLNHLLHHPHLRLPYLRLSRSPFQTVFRRSLYHHLHRCRHIQDQRNNPNRQHLHNHQLDQHRPLRCHHMEQTHRSSSHHHLHTSQYSPLPPLNHNHNLPTIPLGTIGGVSRLDLYWHDWWDLLHRSQTSCLRDADDSH